MQEGAEQEENKDDTAQVKCHEPLLSLYGCASVRDMHTTTSLSCATQICTGRIVGLRS